jgi:hybrid cluster-associated redox disulfide protein
MEKKTEKKKEKEDITKDMPITEIVEKHPETIGVFMQYGMHCLGCVAARFENLEEGAKAHGIDVGEFINELNKAVKAKKAEKKR